MQEPPLCSELTLSSKEFDNTKNTKNTISVKTQAFKMKTLKTTIDLFSLFVSHFYAKVKPMIRTQCKLELQYCESLTKAEACAKFQGMM